MMISKDFLNVEYEGRDEDKMNALLKMTDKEFEELLKKTESEILKNQGIRLDLFERED